MPHQFLLVALLWLPTPSAKPSYQLPMGVGSQLDYPTNPYPDRALGWLLRSDYEEYANAHRHISDYKPSSAYLPIVSAAESTIDIGLSSALAGTWQGASAEELAVIQGEWRIEEVSKECSKDLGIGANARVWLRADTLVIEGAIKELRVERCEKSKREAVFRWTNSESGLSKNNENRQFAVYFMTRPFNGRSWVKRDTLWVEESWWATDSTGGTIKTKSQWRYRCLLPNACTVATTARRQHFVPASDNAGACASCGPAGIGGVESGDCL